MERNERPRYEFSALTMRQAKGGIEICLNNSMRLIRAAKLLFRDGFVEQATFLACTAIEETGKAILLLDFQEQKFCKHPSATINLRRSFTQHVDKLESALFIQKWDETLFREIEKFLQNNTHMDELLPQLLDNIRIESPKAEAKRTFKQRNEMLYTDFSNNKFTSPHKRASKKTFEELIDIAEKAMVRARLDAVLGQICYKRKSSREQFANMVRENYSEIVEECKRAILSSNVGGIHPAESEGN